MRDNSSRLIIPIERSRFLLYQQVAIDYNEILVLFAEGEQVLAEERLRMHFVEDPSLEIIPDEAVQLYVVLVVKLHQVPRASKQRLHEVFRVPPEKEVIITAWTLEISKSSKFLHAIIATHGPYLKMLTSRA